MRVSTFGKELLALSGAEHGLLIEQYDVIRDWFVYRWFAGGRNTAFKINAEDLATSLSALDSTFQKAVEAWRATEPGDDSEAEYDRLKLAASAARLSWAEDRLAKVLDTG